MQYTALSTVKQRIQIGAPLPFNVRNADKTLLLARGQPVMSRDQLDALFERGALVDIAELQSASEQVRQAPRQELPRLWSQTMNRVGLALTSAPHHSFRSALDDATAPALSLIERDPDLAIFQVLRQEGGASTAYSVRRAVHAAITAYLVGQRLGWQADELERAFKVALTMNVSMFELQAQMSRQTTPPTAEQRSALQSHPLRSVQALVAGGVTDPDWLQAVERHHEMEDGSGYPRGCTDVGDLASLARRADIYTAKLSARNHRDGLSADVAGRQMFMEDPGHPMTAALVKEFGIYPPGCHVRLLSGVLAIVVQRGPTVTTPIVACLTNERGAALPEPLRIDTSLPGQAVAAIVGERSVNVSVSLDRLVKLTIG
jgi:alkylated DNA repair dioxygenase AlkB